MLQVGSNWSSSKGGLDRYYNGLLDSFTENGVDHFAIAYDLSDIRSDNPRYMSFGSSKCGIVKKSSKQLYLLKSLMADMGLIVSHCTPSIYPGLSWLGKTPLICHFHGPRSRERSIQGHSHFSCGISRHIENAVYRRAKHFIVLSKYMSSILNREYGVPAEKITIVPGGVDLDFYRPVLSRIDARKRFRLPVDRFIITAVRRLDRRMGLDNLILAMRTIVSTHQDALLLIFGEGPLQDELARLIEVNSLSEHVILKGFVPDKNLAAVYRFADITVLPTINLEGFGMSILESLASGTPVMGTPVGAIPEVLTSINAGLIFDSIQPDDIARGIMDVISSRKKLPDETTCIRYAEEYSWTRISKQILEVYERVLNSP
ncbi:MAG: glycosyltransferase family 4 protein [bacterium]